MDSQGIAATILSLGFVSVERWPLSFGSLVSRKPPRYVAQFFFSP